MKLKALNDDELIKLSKGEVTTYKDYDLTTKPIRPVTGGLFDEAIFGAGKKCSCGYQTKYGKCPICGAQVVSYSELAERVGHYILNFPYVSKYKYDALFEYLTSLSSNYSIVKRNQEGRNVGDKKGHTLYDEVWNYKFQILPAEEDSGNYQFDTEDGSMELEVTRISEEDKADEFEYCGWLGLYKVIKFIPKIGEFVNKVILIPPVAMRPVSITKYDGDQDLQFDPLNQYLVSIIKSDMIINEIIYSYDNIKDRLVLLAMMNRLIDEFFEQNQIVAPSKESLVRGIFSRRVGQSGRGVIVGCTDLAPNKLRLPYSLAYFSAKDEIVKRLRQEGLNINEAMQEYNKMSPKVKELFENVIIPNCCVVFVRNPSISKNSVMAFRVELWDEIAIGIPLLACKAYNADFDGDTMAYWFVFDKVDAEITIKKMGVENNWFYESTGEAVLKPEGEILQGLYMASCKRRYGDKTLSYDNFEDIQKDYDKGNLKVDQEILFNNELTTYGRQKLSQIIKIDYDMLFGNEVINTKTIGKLMSAIFSKIDKIDILQKLVVFANDVVTDVGMTSISLTDIFSIDVENEEYQKILNSNLPDKVKFIKLKELMPKIIKEQVDKLANPMLKGVIEGSGRVKMGQLVEMLGPRLEYNKDTGLIPYRGSLGLGNTESGFVSTVIEGRDILGIKKILIPDTGYLQRMLIDLSGEYLFTLSDSTSKNGAVLRRKDAVGRVLMDGTVIEPNKSNEFVRVKSCIDNGTNYVSTQEVDQTLPEYRRYEENHPIGISFSKSASKDLIQGALGLKHGGSKLSPSKTRLTCITTGTIVGRNAKWLTIKGNNGQLYKYPVPNNITWNDTIDQSIIQEGEVLGYEDRLVRIEQKLSDLFQLLGSFKHVGGVRPNTFTISYAPESGTITYDLDKGIVRVGSVELEYNPDLFYIYPDGYQVKKGDKISSGLLDVQKFYEIVGKDLGWTYYVFHEQLKELASIGNIKSELFEVIFKAYSAKESFSIRTSMQSQNEFLVQLKHGYGTGSILSKFVDKDIGEGFTTELLLNIRK